VNIIWSVYEALIALAPQGHWEGANHSSLATPFHISLHFSFALFIRDLHYSQHFTCHCRTSLEYRWVGTLLLVIHEGTWSTALLSVMDLKREWIEYFEICRRVIDAHPIYTASLSLSQDLFVYKRFARYATSSFHTAAIQENTKVTQHSLVSQ